MKDEPDNKDLNKEAKEKNKKKDEHESRKTRPKYFEDINNSSIVKKEESISEFNTNKKIQGSDYALFKIMNEMGNKNSGADIAKVCREAGMMAIEENIECESIDIKYLYKAIENTKPIINKEMIKYFENFKDKIIEQYEINLIIFFNYLNKIIFIILSFINY